MSNYLVLPCGKTDFLLDNASTCFSGCLKKVTVITSLDESQGVVISPLQRKIH
ncbi:MAG: hypothetical protein IKG79_09010 [Neisseriaceae bacterium]|nr:hypothetical protein [Neisseriaceae bacterium]